MNVARARRAFLLTAILIVVALTRCASVPPADPCAMSAGDEQWLASAVATWGQASALLDRPVEEFPHAIVYDSRCAWHLNAPPEFTAGDAVRRASLRSQGERIPIRALLHDDAVELPSGQTITSDPLAFTGLSKAGRTFFVMALPSQWVKHPGMMPGENIDGFARGVFAHEVVHTLHLKTISDRFDEMSHRYELPPELNDDYLQTVFEKDPEYVEAYQREEALLWESVRTKDDGQARELIREARKLADERRAKYFTGANAFFAEAEPLFLNMEGVACWVANSVAPEGGNPEEHVGRFWSQRQGLAMFLLIDRFAPEWKQSVLSSDVPSPYTMLSEAVR